MKSRYIQNESKTDIRMKMPKEKSSRTTLLKSWISSEPNNFVIQDTSLKCMLCNIILEPSNRNDVLKHIKTKVHTLALTGASSESDFKYDITKAFVSSNIPLIKLENPNLKQFLEKWTHQDIPHESTCRKWYVEKVYDNTIKDIRKHIDNNYIWISIDETTDVCGRYILNFLVGVVNGEVTGPHLLCTKEIESPNHGSVVKFVNNSLEFLWKENYVNNKDRVLMFVTHAASYMLKAGKLLKQKYPNLYHITCAVHGLNRVAEEVRRLYPEVDQLISSVKKVFVKAPERIKYFQEQFPLVALPPEPVTMRWNTWLEAAFYYSSNYDSIANIIWQFDPDDSIYIQIAQDALRDNGLKDKLFFLKTNFSALHNSIQKLENSVLSLSQSFEILNSAESSMFNLRCPTGISVRKKFKHVLEQNPDLAKLRTVCDYLQGKSIADPINKDIAPLMKYCPIISPDVERIFSINKYLLTDRRRKFTLPNLEKHIVINFKYNPVNENTK